MNTLSKSDILNLSVAERILLVEDIWDSVAEVPEAVKLSDADKAELDARLTAYHSDPDSGSPWGTVKERIKNQYG
ncbi:addiction module protein [Pontiella sp.]|uniref:addiction module protein n=1 Tax=Pontiella sp. TaxID=2837462 RepID=UPI0035698D75